MDDVFSPLPCRYDLIWPDLEYVHPWPTRLDADLLLLSDI